MGKFVKILSINLIITIIVLFLLLILFFLMGSGSTGFDVNWYYLILITGLLHSLLCAYKLRSEKSYYFLISFMIMAVYLYFYFE
jgi:hypothetical protein